jgi:hypothetical protein
MTAGSADIVVAVAMVRSLSLGKLSSQIISKGCTLCAALFLWIENDESLIF